MANYRQRAVKINQLATCCSFMQSEPLSTLAEDSAVLFFFDLIILWLLLGFWSPKVRDFWYC